MNKHTIAIATLFSVLLLIGTPIDETSGERSIFNEESSTEEQLIGHIGENNDNNDAGFNIISFLSDCVNTTITAISEAIDAIVNFITGLFDSIISTITGLLGGEEQKDGTHTEYELPTVDGIDLEKLKNKNDGLDYIFTLMGFETQNSELNNIDLAQDLVIGKLGKYYDVFYAEIVNERDGSSLEGIGLTDLSECYLDNNNDAYFSSGFISFDGKMKSDPYQLYGKDDNSHCRYLLKFKVDDVYGHFIRNGQYVMYKVDDSSLIVEEKRVGYGKDAIQKAKEYYDQTLGDLFSYDDDKYLLIQEGIGDYKPVTGSSLYRFIDYDELEKMINEQLKRQDIDWFSMDVGTIVYYSQEVWNNYIASLNEEKFLGYSVKELNKAREKIGPNQYLSITPEGYSIKDIPINPSTLEEIARWTLCVEALIASVALTAVTFVAPEFAPLTMAIAGGAFELGMELINGPLSSVSIGKIAVAAVGGALFGAASSIANVAVGCAAEAVVSGAIEASFTAIDGGDIEDVTKSAANGAALGLIAGGLFKYFSKEAKMVKPPIKPKEIPKNLVIQSYVKNNDSLKIKLNLAKASDEMTKIKAIEHSTFKSLSTVDKAQASENLVKSFNFGTEKIRSPSAPTNVNIKGEQWKHYEFNNESEVWVGKNNVEIYGNKNSAIDCVVLNDKQNPSSTIIQLKNGNQIKVDYYIIKEGGKETQNVVYSIHKKIKPNTDGSGENSGVFEKIIYAKKEGSLKYEKIDNNETVRKYVANDGKPEMDNGLPISGKERSKWHSEKPSGNTSKIPIKHLKTQKKYYDKDGHYAGRMDEDGHYFDKDGHYAGRMDEKGHFYDKDGHEIGYVDEKGRYYDKDGHYAARMDEHGY